MGEEELGEDQLRSVQSIWALNIQMLGVDLFGNEKEVDGEGEDVLEDERAVDK